MYFFIFLCTYFTTLYVYVLCILFYFFIYVNGNANTIVVGYMIWDTGDKGEVGKLLLY